MEVLGCMTRLDIENVKVIPVIAPTPYDVGDVNMYLAVNGKSLILIDAGDDNEACWNALLTGLKLNGYCLQDLTHILLTHSHQDHIGLVNRITSCMDIPVYAHKESLPRLKRDPGYLSMRIRFFEKLYREMGCGEIGNRQVEEMKTAMQSNEKYKINTHIIPLAGSDSVEKLKVIEVPGHSPDHIAFWAGDRKWLFGGDHLIKHISSNAFVEPDLEGNRILSLVQYAGSLADCLKLDAETVFPGHGELIHDHRALITLRLARIEQKAERLRTMIQAGMTTAFQLAQQYYPTKYLSLFFPVMSEIIGLLDYLESKAKIGKVQRNGIWHYEA
jgi:glyoxylase-like metal-dependent hydrolase (beta-lactamase superfamily II)